MFLILLVSMMSLAGKSHPESWEPAEHRMLADSALQILLNEFGSHAPNVPGASNSRLTLRTVIWGDRSFGRLAEAFAENDGDASRFQQAGRTVFEQLGEVSEAQLRSFWQRVSIQNTSPDQMNLVQPEAGTAVANYLLAHMAALRYAGMTGSAATASQYAFFLMLAYESLAQGFLADAHASGHLLVPRHDALQALHPVNNGHAHHHYNSEGVYVVNGRHEAWRTFGDGVLTWYTRSYRQVLEASVASLREVFLAFYAAGGVIPPPLERWVRSFTDRPALDLVDDWLTWKEGSEYYASLSAMPALSYIPMPVSATWSVRSQAKDPYGIRIRQHYPQFREIGYHDPNLPKFIRSSLYSRTALPPRFIPEELGEATDLASALAKNPDAASVEFIQVHKLRPDYAGLLTGLGVGVLTDDEQSAPVLTGSLGYGFAESIIIATHISINLGLNQSIEEGHVSPVTATFGMNPAGLPLRAEIGYVTTTDDFMSESGLVLSGAYDLSSQVLGWTYIGTTVRLRYAVMFLDKVQHVPSIEIAFY